MTQTETATIENNIPIEENNQGFDTNFSGNAGGLDANLAMTGDGMQSSIPIGVGSTFETGASQGGLVMGMGDSAQAFGNTQTTTTTSSVQYGLGQTQEGGLLMGVSDGVQDNAVDVTYSSNTGMNTGAGATTQMTTTTTTTQYGLSGTEGQIVQGDGNGLVMGVGGGVEDNAVDITYSSNTGNLGAAAAKTTTTTTTTTTQYGLGSTQGQIVQGDGNGLVMGVGGGVEDNAVDITP